jgi:2-dehydropantoate 2-reductase
MGVISALSGYPFHLWLSQPTTNEILPALMAEIIAVGRAMGLTEEQLPNNAGELVIQRSLGIVKSGVKHIPSIQLDVMNRRPIEVEGILGFLVKKGRSHNVAVPVSSLQARLPMFTLPSET